MNTELVKLMTGEYLDIYGLISQMTMEREIFKGEPEEYSAYLTRTKDISTTIFINLMREYPAMDSIRKQMQNKVAELNKQIKANSESSSTPKSIPNPDKELAFWKFHFNDIIAELGPCITGAISYGIKNGYTPEQMQRHVTEYAETVRKNKKN